jgi:hypothetical protein
MNATNQDNTHGNGERPVTSRLHPRIYAVAAALSLWLIISVWIFAGGGIVDYLLVIISGFIFIVVALQFILWRATRIEQEEAGDEPQSFRDWATKWDFDTGGGRLSGAQAATQILLPIAAVAVGMSIFGIVLHIAEHSV